MGERIAWMMSSRSDTFAINLKYTDIKSQKISPEGKAKIQLQVERRFINKTIRYEVDLTTYSKKLLIKIADLFLVNKMK